LRLHNQYFGTTSLATHAATTKSEPAMSLPAERKLTAFLLVLTQAVLAGRMLGYAGHATGLAKDQSDKLADLTDAVHNIPYQIENWDRCNEGLFRGMLAKYDQKWRGRASVRLRTSGSQRIAFGLQMAAPRNHQLWPNQVDK